MQKVSEHVRAIRNELMERGWTQLVLKGSDGSLCIMGGSCSVLYGYENVITVNPNKHSRERWDLHYHFMCIFTKVMGVVPAAFNDARGRTLNEVLDALDKVEKVAEEMGD